VLAGDFDNAHRQFSLGGSQSDAAYNLGMAYMSVQRFKDATRAFAAARQADPASAKALNRLRQLSALPAAPQ
jgi:TolA-binding protein